jgi:hypothetical protein
MNANELSQAAEDLEAQRLEHALFDARLAEVHRERGQELIGLTHAGAEFHLVLRKHQPAIDAIATDRRKKLESLPAQDHAAIRDSHKAAYDAYVTAASITELPHSREFAAELFKLPDEQRKKINHHCDKWGEFTLRERIARKNSPGNNPTGRSNA